MTRITTVRRRRYVLLLCVGAAAFLASAAVAVGGMFSGDEAGTRIPGGSPSGPPEFRQVSDETVLASGSLPVAGRWRLTAYDSEGTVEDGVEVEPAGLSCVRLMLAAPPHGTPFAGRGFCGQRGQGGFSVASLAVRDDMSDATEVVLFGHAPEGATAVRLIAQGGDAVATNTRDAYDGFAGDVWAMAVDPEAAIHGEVEWIGKDGRVDGTRLSPGKDVRGQLEAID